jgi:uncharacterized protein YqgC (DUF456 family)
MENSPVIAAQPGQELSAIDHLIPTKNLNALVGYYLGIFSIIPAVGLVLGPAASILGILGLKELRRNPALPGRGHALTGVVIGSITTLANWVVTALIMVA